MYRLKTPKERATLATHLAMKGLIMRRITVSGR
jgi:hypothetical protein